VDDKAVTGSVKLAPGRTHLSHIKRVNVDVYDGSCTLTAPMRSEIEKSDAEIAGLADRGVEQVITTSSCASARARRSPRCPPCARSMR